MQNVTVRKRIYDVSFHTHGTKVMWLYASFAYTAKVQGASLSLSQRKFGLQQVSKTQQLAQRHVTLTITNTINK